MAIYHPSPTTIAPPDVSAEANGQAVRDTANRVRGLRERVLAEVGRVVVGMEAVTEQLLIALLSAGHVLIEGVPGVAKTTLSKAFARILGGQYQRIQFTPDLLPSDVTGTYIFDRKADEFVLRQGPIFCQVLLADEVNRAAAKTQSALLEAMQEYQVTSRERRCRCRSRSWCWRRKIRSSRKASTGCRKHSSTASCCA